MHFALFSATHLSTQASFWKCLPPKSASQKPVSWEALSKAFDQKWPKLMKNHVWIDKSKGKGHAGSIFNTPSAQKREKLSLVDDCMKNSKKINKSTESAHTGSRTELFQYHDDDGSEWEASELSLFSSQFVCRAVCEANDSTFTNTITLRYSKRRRHGKILISWEFHIKSWFYYINGPRTKI